MSSPQKENGYTAIANEIMEALAKARISGEARQMLDVIIRKTYGFNKKQDRIATSQFMELTGLPRYSVHRARIKLLKMNLITVTKKGDSQILIYSLQKDYDKWKLLPKKVTVTKKVTGYNQKSNRLSPKKVTKCNQKSDTQKKERQYTKDTFTKERWVFLKDKDFEVAFNDYLTMRQKIRRLATPRAQELILMELHKYDIKTAIAMLEQSIVNSWQGIFPLKHKGNLTKAQEASVQSMDKLNKRLKEEGYNEENQF